MDIDSSRFMLIAALFSLGLYTGCGAPAKPAVADRQEPQYSESLNDSVADAKRLNDEIRDAFAAGDLQAADGPVHEIGHLLASLSERVGQMSLSEADQQKVDFATNSLMDCFGALDERLHGGESKGKSYGNVAESIDTALSELIAIVNEGPQE